VTTTTERMQAVSGPLRAGVARAEVKVERGIPVGGWGARLEHGAIGTFGRLTVTALALRAAGVGSSLVVLVATDVPIWPDELAATVRANVAQAIGCDPHAVVLTATHVHSMPYLDAAYLSAWGDDGRAAAKLDEIAQLVPALCAEAAATMRPVALHFARRVAAVTRSRRQRAFGQLRTGVAEPVDALLDAVRLVEPSGRTLATIVAYGSHPTIVSWEARFASPDWPGTLRDVIEPAFNAPCLALQGCSADRAPAVGFSSSPDDVTLVGRSLGHLATGALLEAEQCDLVAEAIEPVESGAPLVRTEHAHPEREPADVSVHVARVSLPLRDLDPDRTAARLAAAHEAVAAGEPEASAELAQALIQEDLANRYGKATEAEVPFAVVRIGPLRLVTWPGELSGDYERAFQADDATPITTVTSAGGYIGYLPVASQFPEGGYEVVASAFSAEAPDLLIAAVRAELERI